MILHNVFVAAALGGFHVHVLVVLHVGTTIDPVHILQTVPDGTGQRVFGFQGLANVKQVKLLGLLGGVTPPGLSGGLRQGCPQLTALLGFGHGLIGRRSGPCPEQQKQEESVHWRVSSKGSIYSPAGLILTHVARGE